MDWIIDVLIAFILLSILTNGVLFVYHRIQMSRERRDLKPRGKFVDVKGLRMNVFCANEVMCSNKPTIVLLSGSGVGAPIFDYKILYSQLTSLASVVVLEKFGYGYADISHLPKDIKTLVDDNREALRKAQVFPPYILMPHSMSALEAIYWTSKFPTEIIGIIGLDMAVPERYHNYQKRLKKIRFFHLMTAIGWQRIPQIFPINNKGLSSEEKRQNAILSYKNALNTDVFRESMTVCENALIVETMGTPNVPMLMFTTTLNKGNGYEAWIDAQTRFAQKNQQCRQIILDCGHNLHYDKTPEIVTEIKKFIMVFSYDKENNI